MIALDTLATVAARPRAEQPDAIIMEFVLVFALLCAYDVLRERFGRRKD